MLTNLIVMSPVVDILVLEEKLYESMSVVLPVAGLSRRVCNPFLFLIIKRK
jgi:hypothetical protein